MSCHARENYIEPVVFIQVENCIHYKDREDAVKSYKMQLTRFSNDRNVFYIIFFDIIIQHLKVENTIKRI